MSVLTLTQEQFCVSFMRKMDLKYYQIVTMKLEQCCKVTDIYLLITMDVDNEIIQIKRFLKRNHVCTQMKLGLVQPPAYSIGRYRVIYGLESLESWIGVELWSGADN